MTRIRGMVRGTDKTGDFRERYMGTSGYANVPVGGTLTLTIAPPAGYRISVAVISLTCDYSIIQEWWITLNGIIFFQGEFDINDFVTFPDIGAYVLTPGETMGLVVLNNDTVARNMQISVAGTTEKI